MRSAALSPAAELMAFNVLARPAAMCRRSATATAWIKPARCSLLMVTRCKRHLWILGSTVFQDFKLSSVRQCDGLLLAHRVIPLRRGIWSQSGHSGLRHPFHPANLWGHAWIVSIPVSCGAADTCGFANAPADARKAAGTNGCRR